MRQSLIRPIAQKIPLFVVMKRNEVGWKCQEIWANGSSIGKLEWEFSPNPAQPSDWVKAILLLQGLKHYFLHTEDLQL